MPENAAFKQTCLHIFKNMQDFGHPLGFHFSYSPESSWGPEVKALILTLNPQSREMVKGKKKEVKHFPPYPWPEEHDFFAEDHDFSIRGPVRRLLLELAKKDAVFCGSGRTDRDLEAFACSKTALASYVPFRTKGAGAIGKAMRQFAKNSYWNEILKLWQPEVIIVFGPGPFAGINSILTQIASPLNEVSTCKAGEIAPAGWKCAQRECVYRRRDYQTAAGKHLRLLGISHPARHEEEWSPAGFAPDEAPVFRFVSQGLENFNF